MATPLIFDLAGSGHVIRGAEMVRVDLDGDGLSEVVTDLAFGTGLLVMPAQPPWMEHGFEGLRALAERHGLVGGDKQHLDAADLELLEERAGLRMRVGGLSGGDVRFAALGLTRIDLGDPEQVEALGEAATDGFGNAYVRQAGARFTIRGQVREYVGVSFRMQARPSWRFLEGRRAAA